jgi:GNAT superfamily N-acetyltransferase
LEFIEVTDNAGCIVGMQWLSRAEPVHRQLRDRLPGEYVERLAQVFAGGARMTLAVDGDAVCAVALWRVIENTAEGRRFFIDDLVSDASRGSHGFGGALLTALESRARELGCDVVALDSGTQRSRAHAFYFRAGYSIPAFSFRKTMK